MSETIRSTTINVAPQREQLTPAAQAARRRSWSFRRWLAGLLFRWAVWRCRRKGHLMGPVFVGPRYAAKHRHFYDVGMLCPRCGGRVRIVAAVPYQFKGHKNLHNAVQAMFRPAGNRHVLAPGG